MAVTIDELQIEIQAKGAESASGIDKLTTSLGALKRMINKSLVGKLESLSSALNGIKAPITVNMNVKGMEQLRSAVNQAVESVPANTITPAVDGSAAAAMNDIKTSTEQAASEFERIVPPANKVADKLKNVSKNAGDAGVKLKEVGKSAKQGTSGLSKFISSLKRILMYRVVRSILSNIAKAAKAGIQNLVQYSKAIGGIDASRANATMSQFASIGMQVKNTLGAAVIPVLNALMPVIQTVANWFIVAANAVNQFFAAISGASMWTKAKKHAVDYAGGLGQAAGAASDLKNAMLGIDELNVISPPGGGGGGGGGGGASMFEEVEIEEPPWLADVQERMERIKEAAVSAWNALKELGASLVSSFKAAWEEGKKGKRLLDTIEGVIENILKTVKNLADGFRKAWDEGDRGEGIFGGIITIATELTGIVEDIFGHLAEWADEVDFGPVTEAFATLSESLGDIAGQLRDDIGPVMENIIKPTLLMLVEDVLPTMVYLLDIAASALSFLITNAVGFASMIGGLFKSIMSGEDVDKYIEEFATNARESLAKLKSEFSTAAAGIAKVMTDDLASDITSGAEKVSAATDGVANAVRYRGRQKTYVDAGNDAATQYTDSIKSGIEAATPAAVEAAAASSAAITEALAGTPTADAARELGVTLATNFAYGISENAVLATTAIQNDMLSPLLEKVVLVFDEIYKEVEYKLGLVESEFSSLKDRASEYFGNIQGVAQTAAGMISSAFKTACGEAETEIGKIKSAVDALPIEKTITINIKTNGSLPTFSGGGILGFARGGIIPAAAGGGRFDRGQLFVAREAGPEIVAGIGGGRTAVMNNNQIVESVSNGVYRAVIDAISTMPQNNGDVVLMIGERELARAARRGEKSSGFVLSTNPAF